MTCIYLLECECECVCVTKRKRVSSERFSVDVSVIKQYNSSVRTLVVSSWRIEINSDFVNPFVPSTAASSGNNNEHQVGTWHSSAPPPCVWPLRSVYVHNHLGRPLWRTPNSYPDAAVPWTSVGRGTNALSASRPKHPTISWVSNVIIDNETDDDVDDDILLLEKAATTPLSFVNNKHTTRRVNRR